jgi:imidazole glycerol-phosphate synthase subunit HisH
VGDVTVIDYGLGNLGSVLRALRGVGTEGVVADSPEKVWSASHLILPGDGAFGYGMAQLRERGLLQALLAHIRAGRPFLGICLGMQLLLEESEEFGLHEGLGILPGRVMPFRPGPSVRAKVPRIGWGFLRTPGDGAAVSADTCTPAAWTDTTLNDVRTGESVYFVHSFIAEPQNSADRLADSEYGGKSVCAVVRRGNVTGCQFHPEKSGPVGLRIIRRFVEAN